MKGIAFYKMSALPTLISLSIGCLLIVITLAYLDYRNGNIKKEFITSLDKTLLGLIVILFFVLGLYLAYLS